MAATVPQYDVPQVEPRPLAAPDQRSVATPELLGGPGQQTMEAGKSLLVAGAGLDAVAYEMQQRKTTDDVLRTETKLKDDYIKQEQEWQKNRQGRFSRGITTDVGAWFDAQIKANNELLKDNKDAQRIFTQRATALRQQRVSAFSHWEVEQTQKSEDESWLASKNAIKSLAAANPLAMVVDAEGRQISAVDKARQDLIDENAKQARVKGWEATVLAGNVTKDLTDLHKQVIQQLTQDAPEKAAAYFEKYKSEIDGTQHAELGGLAKKSTASKLGDDAADKVWAQMGPKTDTAPVELDKMEAEIRKIFKDNEFAKAAGLHAIRERATAHNSSQAEREAENINTVMKRYGEGAGLNSLLRMPEFNALSGKAQTEIRQHVTDRNHMLWARSVEDRARIEQTKMLDYSAAYHVYSDPNVLANMSRAQVQALEPTIGHAYADHLLQKYDAIKAHEGALSKANIDNDAFKTILRSFGFDPEKKLNMKSESDKNEAARMGAMRNEVEDAISREQLAKKRELTREEKDDIARKTLSTSVTRSKWWGFSSESVPAASVIPADLSKVVVPQADRDAIVAEAKKRGKILTNDEIATYYLKKQRGAVK